MAESAEPNRARPKISRAASSPRVDVDLAALKQFLQNSHPVSEKNLFDLFVAKTALDQFPGDVSGVRMIRQVGNEMGPSEGRGWIQRRLGSPAKDEFEKIEPDPHPVDPNQPGDMFDMIDISIQGGFFFSRANQDGVDANDATAFAHQLDLFVANVALEVVITARVGVRNDERPGRHRAEIVEAPRINMREVEEKAELFAGVDEIATKRGQAFVRRPAWRENSAGPGGISSRVGESN